MAQADYNWGNAFMNKGTPQQKLKASAARDGVTSDWLTKTYGAYKGAAPIGAINSNVAKTDPGLTAGLGMAPAKPAITYGAQPVGPSAAVMPKGTTGLAAGGMSTAVMPPTYGLKSEAATNWAAPAATGPSASTGGVFGAAGMALNAPNLAQRQAEAVSLQEYMNSVPKGSDSWNEYYTRLKEITGDLERAQNPTPQPAPVRPGTAPGAFGSGNTSTVYPTPITPAKPSASTLPKYDPNFGYLPPGGGAWLSKAEYAAKYGIDPSTGKAPENFTRGALAGANAPSDTAFQTGASPTAVGLGATPGATLPDIGRTGAPVYEDPYKDLVSKYEGMTNPYGAEHQARLAGQAVGNAEHQYKLMSDRIRGNMAGRGLSAGGPGGIGDGLMNDLAMQTAGARTTGMNDAMIKTTELGAGWDTQRAGALDQFGMSRAGGQSAFQQSKQAQYADNTLMPYRAAGLALGNERTALDNSFTSRTEDDRVAAVRSQLITAGIQNDTAAFQLDQAWQGAPAARERIGLELLQLQAQIKQAEAAGNRQFAADLGTMAASIAKEGGFQWIGAGVGGAIGGLAGSVIPGAGTMTGGYVGAGAGATVGSWLDRLAGGKAA